MKYSHKLRINKQRTRRDGSASLFFQIIIDGAKTTVPLDLQWPAEKFDFDQSIILPRERRDTLHEDYCRQIERKAGEISEVFIWARLARVELNIESFTRELANRHSRHDFLAFWEREADERYSKGKIKKPTYTSNKSSLETLRQHRPQVPFNLLNKAFLDDYKAWLYRTGLGGNTVWKKLKEMRTYCNAAISAGYAFEYPFKGFKMPQTTSRLDYLDEADFLALHSYYHSDDLEEGHAITLRAFLFSCYTGLRISDLMAVSWKDVRKDALVFRPIKRPREMLDMVTIPLHCEAKKLIPGKKGVLIPTVVEQSMNRTIKTIAGRLGLNPNVTFHWARHTFATRFLRHGGAIEVLQQLLGHKKIETTMIYVHVDEQRKRDQINRMPF